MNACTPTIPERPVSEATAHNIAALRRLVDLGMELAELATQLARTQAEPPPEPAAEPTRHPPRTRTLAPSPAPQPAPEQPAPRRPDAFLAFARVARAVCHAIGLQAALEAAASTAPARAPHDPRRAAIRHVLHQATDTHPDRAALRREADALLDHALAIDPLAETPVARLLAAICEDLGVTPDYARLPDDLLDALTPDDGDDPPPDPAPAPPLLL